MSKKDTVPTHSQHNNTEDRQLPSTLKLKSTYEAFLLEASALFPKVDQKFLMDVLKFETAYNDWEGSVMLKVVYPVNSDILAKKEWLYQRYQKVATVEEERTLRVKVVRMYVNELDKLLNDDNDIEYITGSATLTPSDAYSA
jgi:hypothetical protein